MFEAGWAQLLADLASDDVRRQVIAAIIAAAVCAVPAAVFLVARKGRVHRLIRWLSDTGRSIARWLWATDSAPRWASLLGFPAWLVWRIFAPPKAGPAPAITKVTTAELVPLEKEHLDVLYAISAREDTDRVPLDVIVQQTGLQRLRVQVACDVLQQHHLLFPNGANAMGEPVFGLGAKGRQEALKLYVTRAPATNPPQALAAPESPRTQTQDIAAASVVVRGSLTEDFKTYCAEVKRLEGRFIEKEAFTASLEGRTVNWAGYVSSVSTGPGGWITLSVSTGETLLEMFGVFFPESFKTRLFALRKDDLVEISGILRHRQGTTTVDGEAFRLL